MVEENNKKSKERTSDSVLFWWGLVPLIAGFAVMFPWAYLLKLIGSDMAKGGNLFFLAPMIGGAVFAVLGPIFFGMKYGWPKSESTKQATARSQDEVELVMYPAVGGILACFGIWAYQIYMYLKFGEWLAISIITALRWNDVSWAWYPTEWIGVHKLLNQVPLSVAAGAIGIFLTYILVELGRQWSTSRSGSK